MFSSATTTQSIFFPCTPHTHSGGLEQIIGLYTALCNKNKKVCYKEPNVAAHALQEVDGLFRVQVTQFIVR